jgi:hypothetical protein
MLCPHPRRSCIKRVVALRSLKIGSFGALALAVVLGGGCSSAPDVTQDGGKDAAARNDGAHDARLDRTRDGGTDTVRTVDASGDATRDANGSDGTVADCTLGSAGEPLDLRCTGLYSNWASRTIASDVRQYDPGLHLWSDGANKTRWIYLPPGTKIDTSNMDQWMFPVGTKVWKEFDVGGARIETRLLWKKPSGGWYLTTYAWSSDQSTATELTTGKLAADGASFEIPAQSACYDCHNGRYDAVLGFEAVALSTGQASGVTMATLAAANLLTDPPAKPITIPGDATAVAALGYLHMNCGIPCHNPDSGGASGTGLFMRLDVATLASVTTTPTWTTGMGVSSFFAVPGVTSPQIFNPCNPDSSSAYYRMNHRDGVDGTPGGVQMPPEITHEVDTTGVATIAAWLAGLPQCSAGAGAAN